MDRNRLTNSPMQDSFNTFVNSSHKETYQKCREIYKSAKEAFSQDNLDPLVMAILQQLVVKDGRSTIKDMLQKRMDFLEEGASQIRVYVAGEVAVGKTSLINLLMGDAYLPTGHNKCTGIVCEVVHSPVKATKIIYKSGPGLGDEFSVGYLNLENHKDGPNWRELRNIIETKQDKNGREVERVAVYFPFKIFEKDLHESSVKTVTGSDDQEVPRGAALNSPSSMDVSSDIARENVPVPMGKPPVCFMDFPGLEDNEVDDETEQPYKENLDLCHSFIFVLDVSRNDGVHRATILKLMQELQKELQRDGVEFNPEAALFLCTGLPKNFQKDKQDKLQQEILNKLRRIWCMISDEQIVFINNVTEMNQPLVSLQDVLIWFLSNADRLLLEEIFSWLSNLLETSISLTLNGQKWLNSETLKKKVEASAEEYFQALSRIFDEFDGSKFMKKISDLSHSSKREFERKLRLAVQALPDTFGKEDLTCFQSEVKQLKADYEQFQKELKDQEYEFLIDKLGGTSFGKMMVGYNREDENNEFQQTMKWMAVAVIALPVAKLVMFGFLCKTLWEEYQTTNLTKEKCIQVTLNYYFEDYKNGEINSLLDSLRKKMNEMRRIKTVSLAKGIQMKPEKLVTIQDLVPRLWDIYVGKILRHEINLKDIEQKEKICHNVCKAYLHPRDQRTTKETLAMKEVQEKTRTGQEQEKEQDGSTDIQSLPSNSQIYKEVVLLRQLSKKTKDIDYGYFIEYRGSACKCEEENYYLYIFMKWYPQSLHEVLTQPSYPQTPAVKILKYAHGAARGLRFVHNNGIVHRDVKPSNFLVGDNGEVKICDVGHSKPINTLKTFVGTCHYMAPEVVQEQVHNQKSDIYSLGLVFVELFYKMDSSNRRHQTVIEKEDRKLLSSHRPYQLVRDCLKKDPRARCSVHHIVKVLEEELSKENERHQN